MNIFVGVTDDLGSEVNAMIQAMYSRSDMSIIDRIENVDEDVIKNNLKKFYLGYGHKSIGQLGYTTVFIENVSIIAAKVIQNTSLYDGQEVSTRYLDFSDRPMYSNNDEITQWQNKFVTLYNKILPHVIDSLKVEYPYEDNQEVKESTYNNTIKARAFDITRGLLPAGMTTSLSFMGSFDLINDHFGQLLVHPLQEIRDIAKNVLINTKEKYPNAIRSIEELSELNKYLSDNSNHFYSELPLEYNSNFKISIDDFPLCKFSANKLYDTFKKRKSYKEELPRYISNDVVIENTSMLDYGSYRDIHRHRNGKITFPILTVKESFNKFYLEYIPDEYLDEVLDLLLDYEQWYRLSSVSKIEKQYCTPIGYNIRFKYRSDLNQFLYMLELRSQKTVHQTLRLVMHQWEREFLNAFRKYQIDLSNNMFLDRDNESFSYKRGLQTFSL